MGIDLVFLVALAWYGFKGYRKGIVRVLFSAVGMVVATLGALKLSGKVATYFFQKDGAMSPWVPMLSFVAVFVAISFIVFMISKTLDTSLKKVMLGGVNRLAGALLYVVLVAFFFSTLFWIGGKVSLLNEDTKASSMAYKLTAPFAPKGFEIIGTIAPFVKSSYAELNTLFDKAAQKLP